MPVGVETPYVEFTGNGVTTVFDHEPTFTVSDPSHVVVSVDGAVLTSGYTSTATGVVFDVAPTDGVSVVLRRETPLDQPLTVAGIRIFSLAGIAAALDRIVRSLQELFGSSAGTPRNAGAFVAGLDAETYALVEYGTEFGKPVYSTNGTADVVGPDPYVGVSYGDGAWNAIFFPAGASGGSALLAAAPGDEATPDLTTGWYVVSHDLEAPPDLGGFGFLLVAATPGRPGSLRHDSDNLYVQTGTTETPVWKATPLNFSSDP